MTAIYELHKQKIMEEAPSEEAAKRKIVTIKETLADICDSVTNVKTGYYREINVTEKKTVYKLFVQADVTIIKPGDETKKGIVLLDFHNSFMPGTKFGRPNKKFLKIFLTE